MALSSDFIRGQVLVFHPCFIRVYPGPCLLIRPICLHAQPISEKLAACGGEEPSGDVIQEHGEEKIESKNQNK